MVLQHQRADPFQRLLDGVHLTHHVDAVGVVVHHALNAAHVAFDALQPVEYLSLLFVLHHLRVPCGLPHPPGGGVLRVYHIDHPNVKYALMHFGLTGCKRQVRPGSARGADSEYPDPRLPPNQRFWSPENRESRRSADSENPESAPSSRSAVLVPASLAGYLTGWALPLCLRKIMPASNASPGAANASKATTGRVPPFSACKPVSSTAVGGPEETSSLAT